MSEGETLQMVSVKLGADGRLQTKKKIILEYLRVVLLIKLIRF